MRQSNPSNEVHVLSVSLRLHYLTFPANRGIFLLLPDFMDLNVRAYSAPVFFPELSVRLYERATRYL